MLGITNHNDCSDKLRQTRFVKHMSRRTEIQLVESYKWIEIMKNPDDERKKVCSTVIGLLRNHNDLWLQESGQDAKKKWNKI